MMRTNINKSMAKTITTTFGEDYETSNENSDFEEVLDFRATPESFDHVVYEPDPETIPDAKTRKTKSSRHRRRKRALHYIPTDLEEVHEQTTKLAQYKKGSKKLPETLLRKGYSRDGMHEKDNMQWQHGKRRVIVTSRRHGGERDVRQTEKVLKKGRPFENIDVSHVRIKIYPVMPDVRKPYYYRHNLKPFFSRPLQLTRSQDAIKIRIEELGPAMTPVVRNLLQQRSRELHRKSTELGYKYRVKKPRHDVAGFSASINSLPLPHHKKYYEVRERMGGVTQHKLESSKLRQVEDKLDERDKSKSPIRKPSEKRRIPRYVKQISGADWDKAEEYFKQETEFEKEEKAQKSRSDSRVAYGLDEEEILTEFDKHLDETTMKERKVERRGDDQTETPFSRVPTTGDKKNLWSKATKMVTNLLKLAPAMRGEAQKWKSTFPPKFLNMPKRTLTLPEPSHDAQALQQRDKTEGVKTKLEEITDKKDLSSVSADDFENLDEELGQGLRSTLGATLSKETTKRQEVINEVESIETLDDKSRAGLKVRFGPTDIKYVSYIKDESIENTGGDLKQQYSVDKYDERHNFEDTREHDERKTRSELEENGMSKEDSEESVTNSGVESNLHHVKLGHVDSVDSEEVENEIRHLKMREMSLRQSFRRAESTLSKQETVSKSLSDKELKQIDQKTISKSKLQESLETEPHEAEIQVDEISDREAEEESKKFEAKLAHVITVNSDEVEAKIDQMARDKSQAIRDQSTAKKNLSLSRAESKRLEDEEEKHETDWGVQLRHVDTKQYEEVDDSEKHRKDWGVQLRHVETKESKEKESDDSARHKKDWGATLRHVETEESEESEESARHKIDWGVSLRPAEIHDSDDADSEMSSEVQSEIQEEESSIPPDQTDVHEVKLAHVKSLDSADVEDEFQKTLRSRITLAQAESLKKARASFARDESKDRQDELVKKMGVSSDSFAPRLSKRETLRKSLLKDEVSEAEREEAFRSSKAEDEIRHERDLKDIENRKESIVDLDKSVMRKGSTLQMSKRELSKLETIYKGESKDRASILETQRDSHVLTEKSSSVKQESDSEISAAVDIDYGGKYEAKLAHVDSVDSSEDLDEFGLLDATADGSIRRLTSTSQEVPESSLGRKDSKLDKIYSVQNSDYILGHKGSQLDEEMSIKKVERSLRHDGSKMQQEISTTQMGIDLGRVESTKEVSMYEATEDEEEEEEEEEEKRESEVESNKHEARLAHVISVHSSDVEEELRALRESEVADGFRRSRRSIDFSRSVLGEMLSETREEGSEVESIVKDEEEDEEAEEGEEESKAIKDSTYLTEAFRASIGRDRRESKALEDLEESSEIVVDKFGPKVAHVESHDSEDVEKQLRTEIEDHKRRIQASITKEHDKDVIMVRGISQKLAKRDLKRAIKPASPFGPNVQHKPYPGMHWVPMTKPSLNVFVSKKPFHKKYPEGLLPDYEYGIK